MANIFGKMHRILSIFEFLLLYSYSEHQCWAEKQILTEYWIYSGFEIAPNNYSVSKINIFQIIMTGGPPQPRLCQITKVPAFDGYGFNLHAEKNKPGQFVGKIDQGSPAEVAGFREGDREDVILRCHVSHNHEIRPLRSSIDF